MDRKAEQIVNVSEGSHVGTVTQIMRFGIPTIVVIAVILIAIATVSGYNIRTIFEPNSLRDPISVVNADVETPETVTVVRSGAKTSIISIPKIDATKVFSPDIEVTSPIRLDVRTTHRGPGTPSISLGTPQITQEDLLQSIQREHGITFMTEDSFLYALEHFDNECADISIAVTSLVEDEWIRVEPYPLLEIVALDDFDAQGEVVHVIRPPTAGAGYETKYSAHLSDADISGRVTIESYGELPDFFTLTPGENEWFVITPICSAAGSYTLRVGVEYAYKGTWETIWNTELITVHKPSHACYWSLDIGVDIFLGCGNWNQVTEWWEFDYPISIEQWLTP